MDYFVEYIVKRKTTVGDIAKKFFVIFGCVMLTLFFLWCSLAINSIMLAGGAGAIYLAWFLTKRFSVEYEYIITNNDMDIDKIMGQDRRKRLITIKLNTAESFGPYDPEEIGKIDLTVDASDGQEENVWQICCNHEKQGKTLLLFSPNEKILLALNKTIPARLRIKELTQAAVTEITDNDKAVIEGIFNPVAIQKSNIKFNSLEEE